MRRAPSSSPEEHSSNIRASRYNLGPASPAANIRAAAAVAVAPGAPAGRSLCPDQRCHNRHWNSSGPAWEQAVDSSDPMEQAAEATAVQAGSQVAGKSAAPAGWLVVAADRPPAPGW